MKFVVAFSLLCIAAAPCPSAVCARQASELSNVTLTVSDRSGAPVSYAPVEINPQPQNIEYVQVTDKQGKLNLAMPAGEYDLTVMSQGFTTGMQHVEVKSGPSSTVDLVLQFAFSCPPGCPPVLPAPPPPRFDVASVKPVDPKAFHEMGTNVLAGGRVVINGMSVKDLIVIAFDVGWWQISGGEDWTGKTYFDVEAQAPEAMQPELNLQHSTWGVEDVRLREMLQALLIDRFQLTFHMETRPGTVYVLQENGKPLRLKPTKAALATEGSGISRIGGRWTVVDTTIPQLAKFASDTVVHQKVTAAVFLNGPFDFRSEETQPVGQGGQIDFASSFLSALNEMGFELKSTKGPVEYFVIDRAEQPSPN